MPRDRIKSFLILIKIILTVTFGVISTVSLLEIFYSKHVDGFMPYISILSFIILIFLIFNLIKKNQN